MPRFIYRRTAAQMPASAKGVYIMVNILELNNPEDTEVIGIRDKRVKRVLFRSGPFNLGTTIKSAGFRTEAWAKQVVERLNSSLALLAFETGDPSDDEIAEFLNTLVRKE